MPTARGGSSSPTFRRAAGGDALVDDGGLPHLPWSGFGNLDLCLSAEVFVAVENRHPVGGVDYPRTFQEFKQWFPDPDDG